MIYNLKTDKKKAANYLEKLSKQNARIELRVIRKKRSLNQNAYLHLIFTFIGLEIGYTMDETKTIFKKRFLSYEKNGFHFAGATSDLNTKEMTDFIEQIRNHCSQEMSIYVPAPNEYNYIDQMKNEIEQNENWTQSKNKLKKYEKDDE